MRPPPPLVHVPIRFFYMINNCSGWIKLVTLLKSIELKVLNVFVESKMKSLDAVGVSDETRDKLDVTLSLCVFTVWVSDDCSLLDDSFVYFNCKLSIPRQLKSISSLKSSCNRVFANRFCNSISWRNASSSIMIKMVNLV